MAGAARPFFTFYYPPYGQTCAEVYRNSPYDYKNGYDVDYISDAFVQSTRCRDGKLITEGGASYKALIIPAVKLMPERVLQHLLKLAEEGATLIFIENYPEDVPGYGQLEKRRKNFAGWRKQLPSISTFDSTLSTPYQKGTIITGKDYGAALAKSLVFPEEMKVLHGLQYIRRSNDKGYHYFISSLQSRGVDDWVTLSVSAEDVMLFNPLTGEKEKHRPGYKTGGYKYDCNYAPEKASSCKLSINRSIRWKNGIIFRNNLSASVSTIIGDCIS